MDTRSTVCRKFIQVDFICETTCCTEIWFIIVHGDLRKMVYSVLFIEFRQHCYRWSWKTVCMYVCMVIYVRATAYSLDCHVGAMINRRLYRTFQSVVHRTAAVTSTGRELSVAMSSIELGQSMRSFAVHSS